MLQWLRTVRDTKLSRDAKALAGVLVTYANSDGSSCRPGDDRLCDDLTDTRGRRPKEQTVQQYRAELVRAGLMVCVRRGSGPGRGGGQGKASEWRLVIPRNTHPSEDGLSVRNTHPSEDGLSVRNTHPSEDGLSENTHPSESKTPTPGGCPTSPRPPQTKTVDVVPLRTGSGGLSGDGKNRGDERNGHHPGFPLTAAWLADWTARKNAPPIPADWAARAARHILDRAPAPVGRPDEYVRAALRRAETSGGLADYLPNTHRRWAR